MTDTHVLDGVTADGNAGPVFPCSVEDPNLWFSESPTELELAKRHCQVCPVQRDCLGAALARAEPWGVWGGEIFQHGVVIPVKRPRGRPARRRNPA